MAGGSSDRLAIYKYDRVVEVGSTEKQLQLSSDWSEQDLNVQPPYFKSSVRVLPSTTGKGPFQTGKASG